MGDFWKTTCEILQNPADPIVDKPKLQEKYLVKPPFRYCHDIITAVQNKTGFAPGLYAGEELDARAIQDKEAKVAYLQKIINVVGIVLGQPVPAKPSKIVAGLEPENTNLFFQMLGRACQMNNGASAVQQVTGGAAAAPPAPARPASRPSSQQAEPAAPPVEDPRKEKKREHHSKESRSKDREVRPPPSSKHRSSSSKTEPPPAAVEIQPSSSSVPPARPSSARKGHSKSSSQPPPPPATPPAAAAAAVPPPSTPPAAPTQPPGGGRPGTAQRRGSSMGDAPAIRPVAVMAEGMKDNSDDEVEVVHEAVPKKRGAGQGGEQGVLVRDIREAEEKLKKAGADAAQAAGAEEEASGQGIILKRMGNKAGGGTHIKDFNIIREMVQKLCQTSHPLAKSMDYLQEDLENMGKEYRFWQTERRVFADKLADEERLAGDQKGGENMGADLDNQIKQVRNRTLGLKAQVLRNDETVAKLLQMAVSGSVR